MNREVYFTTGEFAKLCNVTKETLFYYDEMEILKPAYVGENGYRYYSVMQYDVLSVILVLREVGMSLPEIRSYMGNRSPEHLLEMLDDQKKRLEEKIGLLRSYKNRIADTAGEVRKAVAAEMEKVTEEDQEEEILLLSEKILSFEEESLAEYTSSLIRNMDDRKLNCGYIFGGIRRTESVKRKDYTSYTHFYLKVYGRAAGVYRKEKGRYLVTYHKGGFDSLAPAYERMLAYAGERGMELDENFYEDVVVDALGVPEVKDYVEKIAVRIRERIVLF